MLTIRQIFRTYLCKDKSYDIVYASHVLEHAPDDNKALAEIKRILSSKGIAILPVPIVADKTIEYPEPNPNETYHVRAPGYDYFDRYEKYFSKIEKYSSDTLPQKYQLYLYEDRTKWPTKDCPLRLPMQGEMHIDIVSICFVRQMNQNKHIIKIYLSIVYGRLS